MFTLSKRTGHILMSILLLLALGSNPFSIKGQTLNVLKDVWPGVGNSSSIYNWMAVANGKLFFTAEDESHGLELWVSDGTEAGTTLLKDIYPGSTWSSAGWAGNFATCNDKLFFIAKDDVHGAELWASDGTVGGTYLVKDIGIDLGSSWSGLGNYGQSGQLYTYNNKVYFAACDGRTSAGYHDVELWCSDGTESGTYMLKDIRPDESSQPKEYCEFNGLLFFNAYDGSQSLGGHGGELWVSDGTNGGTHLFKDIAPVASSETPQYLTVCGDKMFFTTDDGTHGKELWVTDGTDVGTYLVKDICTDAGIGSYPRYLTAMDGLMYFRAFTSNAPGALYRSDGTELGTYQVAPSILDPVNLKVFNGKLYFIAANTFAGGGIGNYELYAYTEATGAILVKEINPDPSFGIDFQPGSNFPEGFVEYNDKLYFRASDDGYGTKLWQTDGTESGTIATPNQDCPYPDPLTPQILTNFTFKTYNGSLYFPGAYFDDPAAEVYKLTSEPGQYQVTGSGSYCQNGTGLPVGLSNSDIGVTYTLYNNGVVMMSGVVGSGEALSLGNWLAGTYTITGTNAYGTVNMIGNATIVAETQLPVTVTLQTPHTNVCTGQTVTISASSINGGNSTYEWFINGVATGSNQNTYSFIPVNGDQVYCILTSDLECVSGNPATSNIITFSVSDIWPASVTISTQPEGCNGNLFTVTASPVNGGNATYEWFVNGTVTTTSTLPSYTYVPANGDQVYVIMTSGLTCATGSPATSNPVVLTVNQPVTPEVTITSSQNPVAAGNTVEFTPLPYNGGTPTYQWYVNDVLTASGNLFSYVPSDLDAVYCKMNSTLACVTASTVTSNTIVVDVVTGVGDEPENGLSVFANGNTIVIESSTSITGIATLTNLSGQVIEKFLLNNETHHEHVANNAAGLYLLKIETKWKTITTKIFLP